MLFPGQNPSWSDINSLAEKYESVSRPSSAGSSEFVSTADGFAQHDHTLHGHWAKIVGGTGNRYAHVKIRSLNGPSSPPLPEENDFIFPVWGTADIRPAVERNNNTAVPDGAVVWLEPDQFGGEHYNFSYGGADNCFVRRRGVSKVWCEDGVIVSATRMFLTPVCGIVTITVIKPGDPDGTVPADKVAVTVTCPDYGDAPISVTTDSEGSAIVKLPEGAYTFTMTPPSGLQAVDPPGAKQTLTVGAVSGCDDITTATIAFELESAP